MKKNLIVQIDQAIEKSMNDLKVDLIKLIAIKSVKGEPLPGAPFGAGPRAVLDTVLDMGKQEGFYTTEHTEGVISLSLKEGQPDLGIWLTVMWCPRALAGIMTLIRPLNTKAASSAAAPPTTRDSCAPSFIC